MDTGNMGGINSIRNVKNVVSIGVEGNIGSGKSTLLQHFKTFPECEIVPEPVEKWTNLKGYNILGMMYENKSQYGFLAQRYIHLTRVQMHTKPVVKPARLMERTVHSARYCFTEQWKDNSDITDPEYAVLNEWFQWVEDNINVGLDLIVYLRTDPSVSFERLVKRSRSEESPVTINLLEDLHGAYENWLTKDSGFPAPSPVFIVDANKTIPELKSSDFVELRKKINQLISEKSSIS